VKDIYLCTVNNGPYDLPFVKVKERRQIVLSLSNIVLGIYGVIKND
jgi:hypothetical protein